MRFAVFTQACAAVAAAALAGAAAASSPRAGFGEPNPIWTLAPRTIGRSDPLPDIAVGPVSTARASAFGALRLVLTETRSGIGLTYAGRAMPEALRRPVGAANLEGRLPAIVEQLAQVAGFYYRYDARARVLTVSQEREFALALPEDAVQTEALKRRLAQLGARELDAARLPGILTYRAARATEEAIEQELAAPAPVDARFEPGPVAAPTPENPVRPAERSAAAQVQASPAEPAQSGAAAALWTVRSGERISAAFRRWGTRSGWRLVWQAPELEATLDASIPGSFERAVTEVVRSLDENGARLRPIFYAGNRVLRVTAGDDE